MDYKIIDAHAHLWLRQDAEWNGKRIVTLENGRSHFLGEEVQMVPPFMIDGRNTAEIFLSNMNYAQVSAAVITQEYIDGLQNDYLEEVMKRYPNRFFCCGMCEYFREDVVEQARALQARGFRAIKIPANRLKTDAVTVHLTDPKMVALFDFMEQEGMILSIDLDDDLSQIAEMEQIILTHPQLKVAIGHFGMATYPTFMDQVRLARYEHVMIESGGITWLYNSEFYPFHGAIRAIRQAADEVGMEKLMWGSDYPRTITAITYRMSYDFVSKSTELTEEEKAMFLGGNAARFYGLTDLVELPYIKNMSE
ncbi:MAG: amidohydrolase [Alistipes sp.]|nr:amidohydrolase [Alistipes sp.]